MRNFFFVLLAALLPHPVFAQHPDKQPTAQISSPRSLSDLGFQRVAGQDATLQGGSAYGGSDSRVPYDVVALPPCAISPNAPGCYQGYIDDRLPPTIGGGAPELGHCGVPANFSLNRDPDCTPVQGGWRCFRPGTGTIYYNCP